MDGHFEIPQGWKLPPICMQVFVSVQYPQNAAVHVAQSPLKFEHSTSVPFKRGQSAKDLSKQSLLEGEHWKFPQGP